MREILARNALAAEDLVSCIFTLTPDLDAEFPAVAAREMGLSGVPLLCAREIPVPGALPHVIRVLIHAYMRPARAGARLSRRGAPSCGWTSRAPSDQSVCRRATCRRSRGRAQPAQLSSRW